MDGRMHEMLDCIAVDCPSWVSDNVTAPEQGHCCDERVLACYRRSRARFIMAPSVIEPEETGEDTDGPVGHEEPIGATGPPDPPSDGMEATGPTGPPEAWG